MKLQRNIDLVNIGYTYVQIKRLEAIGRRRSLIESITLFVYKTNLYFFTNKFIYDENQSKMQDPE